MALLWVEGFEKWADVGNTIPSNATTSKMMSNYDHLSVIRDGRYSGKSMQFGSTSVIFATPELAPSRTLIVGVNFKIATFSADSWVFDLRHPVNDGETVGWNQFTLKTVDVSGNIELRLFRGGTSLATTNINMQQDTWYAIELQVYCDSTSGTANLYVNGVEEIAFSGNTRHRTAGGTDRYSRVMIRTHNVPTHYIDDLYVMDDTGNTNNAPLLTNWRIEALSPTSDVTANWTPSTGNDAYALLDEDERTGDYISETQSGNRALFELSSLTANGATGTIVGVQVNVESSKTDRYKKVAKIITQNGAVGSVQDGRDMTSSFNPSYPMDTTEIMETDPDGNAWTAATVNSLRVGVEVK